MLASLGLRFTVAAIIVILAGTVLARSGDVIAARTKLGGVWVGSVFLALATSLPELVTDIAAVRMGALDLAIGDLFGSSMANMLILAIVGLAPAGAELFVRATLDHVIYAALAIVLTAAAAASILAPTSVAWLGIGVGSWILLLVYGVASRAAFRSSRVTQEAGQTIEMSGPAESIAAVPSPHDDAAPSLPRALLHFAGAALVILLVAPQFATAAEGLAVATGVGSTFMGTWLVGLSTSLPELVTSLAAVRMGAFDLAVGNLFGSNAINMVIFAILDPINPTGPVLPSANPTHVLTALVSIILMAIAIAALVLRSRRIRFAQPASILILIGYLLGIGLVFWRSTTT